MNSNFIAPEALDDSVHPTCRHCSRIFSSYDDKISYFQGTCPHCGSNPSILQKQSVRLARWDNVNYTYNHSGQFPVDTIISLDQIASEQILANVAEHADIDQFQVDIAELETEVEQF
jgi:hypothetical protein